MSLILQLIKNNYLSIIVFLLGIIFGYSTCNYIKNKEIDKLNLELSTLKTNIIKQDNDYKNKILEIDKQAKIKEKENYDNFQKTIDDNQNRIDNLQSSNSGLRVKIKQLTRTETSDSNTSSVGNAGSSTTGQTAELDTTTSTNTLRIMQRCDNYKNQLIALQDYINTYNKNTK